MVDNWEKEQKIRPILGLSATILEVSATILGVKCTF
jgi:hypothetical protein